MSSVFEPVRLAHALWLQQDDQLSLEVDERTTFGVGTTAPLASGHPLDGTRPTPKHQSNGHRPHSSIGKRAAGGRREEV